MSGNQVREVIFEPKCKMHIIRPLIHVTLALLMLCAGIAGQTKDKEKEKVKQGQVIADVWWAYVGSGDVRDIVAGMHATDPELADDINNWLEAAKKSGEQKIKIEEAATTSSQAAAKVIKKQQNLETATRNQTREAERVKVAEKNLEFAREYAKGAAREDMVKQAKEGLEKAEAAKTDAVNKYNEAVKKTAEAKDAAEEAQTTATNAKSKLKDEKAKGKVADDALELSEKPVDPAIRENLKTIGEKKMEKARQERVDEDANKSIPKPKPENPKEEPDIKTQVEQPKLPKADPCLEGFSSTTTSPRKVSVDRARTRIKCYIAHIEERKKYMAGAYYDVGAKKTLETSFKAKGVTASMTYADSWGEMGIGLTWSESAKKFYDHHQDVLNQLLDIIQERGYATGSEMASLDKGMQGFDNYDRNIEFQFKNYVESYTEEAKVNDEKEAVSKKYGVDLGQVSAARPYNASAVAALNVQYAQAVKPLDAKVRLIESDQSVIKTSIANLAGQNMFPVFKKAP